MCVERMRENFHGRDDLSECEVRPLEFVINVVCCCCCFVCLTGGCKPWKTQLGTPIRRITCSNHRWRYRKSCTHETRTCRWGSKETVGAGKSIQMPFHSTIHIFVTYIHSMLAVVDYVFHSFHMIDSYLTTFSGLTQTQVHYFSLLYSVVPIVTGVVI